MTDVFLYQSIDDGDVIFENGDLRMDGGLQTAAYISLFGGNKLDSAGSDKTNTWWANLNETDSDLMYRSRTQYLLDTKPLTSELLVILEEANVQDLQWLIDNKVATTIESTASIPRVNAVKLVINIDGVELVYVESLDV